MEKRISYSQFQSVKCVAKACDPLISKRNKLKEKIEKLVVDYKDCDTQISSLEAGIVQVMGFHVDELVKKVIESGVDVNGQPKKTTKYLPTDIVSYDETHKQYVITTPDTTSTSADAPEVQTEISEIPQVEETEPTTAETTVPETSVDEIFG